MSDLDIVTATAGAPSAPASTGTTAEAAPAAAAAPTNVWRDNLPEDLKNDPAILKFMDVSDLAKSYKNLEKSFGRDKISIPDKHATDEDYKELFHKLGNPKDIKDYAVNVQEDAVGSVVDSEFVEWYKEQAHGLGILPKQAQELLSKYVEKSLAADQASKEAQQASLTQTVQTLKEEWGQAFEHKIKAAQRAVEEFGGEELVSALNNTGAGNNPHIIKAFAKMSEFLKEDKTVAGAGTTGAMTPVQLVEKAKNMMADPAHPFNNKAHPNHEAAKKEVAHLYSLAYPE